MNINKIHRLQRGQAMSEYMVIVPAAIMIAIAAGLISSAIIGALTKTVDAFETAEQTCQVAEDQGARRDGATTTDMGNHNVTLSSVVYNEADDTTTIAYRVTSGPSPSISHWTLGLPAEVAGKMISANEQYERGTDPTTGVTGVKFDTGYEVNTNGGGGNGGGGNGGGGNGGGGKGGGKGGNGDSSAQSGTIVLARYNSQSNDEDIETVSRTVILLVSGQFDFGSTTVSIKAGQDVHTATISAPVSLYVKPAQGCES
ncbi:MAG: hypothetical protein OHK0046_11690 [Anaerolineae bacterium]